MNEQDSFIVGIIPAIPIAYLSMPMDAVPLPPSGALLNLVYRTKERIF
jgi:hypothetical protein